MSSEFFRVKKSRNLLNGARFSHPHPHLAATVKVFDESTYEEKKKKSPPAVFVVVILEAFECPVIAVASHSV